MVRALFLSLSMMVFAANSAVVLAWPIPDTGQTKCYDEAGTEIDCAGTGQDGEYLINPPSYTKLDKNGNDLPDTATEWVMVRDNVTGLIWEVKQNQDGAEDYTNPHDADNKYTWYDSNSATNGGNAGKAGDGTDTEDFITALNAAAFGGYTNWRLPTRMELKSIADFAKLNPSINDAFFSNTILSDYWTSVSYIETASDAWGVNFIDCHPHQYDKSSGQYVYAVRNEKSVLMGHMVINPDDTITDTNTGLMWQKNIYPEMTWQNAVSHCQSIDHAGYEDWRLPTLKELESIAALDRFGPSLNTEFFQ